MKENICKTIDFDCYVNDFMAFSESECVFTEEGYNTIQKKYEKEINQFLKDMEEQYSAGNEKETYKPDFSLDTELPCRKDYTNE